MARLETLDDLLGAQLRVDGELLHEHWMNKRTLAQGMTDPVIDGHYEAARRAGAVGGKLMGAGGGGFLMFYARPRERGRVVETLLGRGLRPLDFRFHFEGATIVSSAPSRTLAR